MIRLAAVRTSTGAFFSAWCCAIKYCTYDAIALQQARQHRVGGCVGGSLSAAPSGLVVVGRLGPRSTCCRGAALRVSAQSQPRASPAQSHALRVCRRARSAQVDVVRQRRQLVRDTVGNVVARGGPAVCGQQVDGSVECSVGSALPGARIVAGSRRRDRFLLRRTRDGERAGEWRACDPPAPRMTPPSYDTAMMVVPRDTGSDRSG
jgi:hypothetical protein